MNDSAHHSYILAFLDPLAKFDTVHACTYLYIPMHTLSTSSILMDRGDRVSIQGDGHPTMATALSAFGSADTYDLVHTMLVTMTD